MVKSCYIHIPFCNTICSYCDFCKMYYHKKFVKDYFKKLKEEINRDYQGEVLDTIYIGGGTPSCLSYSELEELFEILSVLKKNKSIEYTIECNLESITIEKIKLFVLNGINRISIGIESIDSNNLLLLDRKFDKEECISKIKMIRDSGIKNLNLDLMYALPDESMDILKKDLEFLLSLEPEHISTYSLIIEDHTKLGIHRIKNISDDVDFDMYQMICHLLKENGYHHYEISNFAKEGGYSKHNLCYWKNLEYYGFGLGASSYINSIRKSNTRSLEQYPISCDLEEVNKEQKMEYEILLGLRLLDGIDLLEFYKKYNIELIEIYPYSDLVDMGLLIEDDHHLRIPEDKIYVSNEIIVKLLEKKDLVC